MIELKYLKKNNFIDSIKKKKEDIVIIPAGESGVSFKNICIV